LPKEGPDVTDLFANFLSRLDEVLVAVAAGGERLDLFHIGASALIVHYGLKRLTRDFDIVMMRTPLEARAAELFGRDSPNAVALGLYLELVPQGAPPVSQGFRKRCVEVPGPWKVLRLWRPEPHDLAATKLKYYRPQDREDLMFLCNQGLVTAEGLRRSLESAFLWVHEKDDDPDRDRAFHNLAKMIAYLEGRASSL
jgi:hypothetical protein